MRDSEIKQLAGIFQHTARLTDNQAALVEGRLIAVRDLERKRCADIVRSKAEPGMKQVYEAVARAIEVEA